MRESIVGHVILARIEERVFEAVSRGIAAPARGRAIAARARDSIEPVRRQLLALDTTEEDWSGWVTRLRDVFVAADESCRALATVLADRTQGAPRAWHRLA